MSYVYSKLYDDHLGSDEMPVISREVIFAKLGEVGMKTLQSAFEFASRRRDAYIEPVHWLAQILRTDRTDLSLLVDRLALDRTDLAKDLDRALGTVRRTGSSRLDFSRDLELMIERGWISASLMFGASRIRTGHLLHGMLEQPELKRLLLEISPVFRSVAADQLAQRFLELTDGSSEVGIAAEATPLADGATPGAGKGEAPSTASRATSPLRHAPARSIPCSAATRRSAR